MFFFEKKNQKTFIREVDGGAGARRVSQVFCVFSSAKKTFPTPAAAQ
jgi:hypothetical protein